MDCVVGVVVFVEHCFIEVEGISIVVFIYFDDGIGLADVVWAEAMFNPYRGWG